MGWIELIILFFWELPSSMCVCVCVCVHVHVTVCVMSASGYNTLLDLEHELLFEVLAEWLWC